MNILLMLLGLGIFGVGAAREFTNKKPVAEIKPEPKKIIDPVAVIEKPAPDKPTA